MRADETYKALADLLPQIVFEIDRNGTITFANQEAFNTFGYTQDEFDQGLNGIQMFIPEDREHIEQAISQILTGEKLEAVELTAIRKDETTFPTLAYGLPKIQDGESVGVTGIIVDISERKQAEKELQRKEEYFRALIENSSDAIAIIDANGILSYRGSTVGDVLGVPTQDRVGKSGLDFVHPDDLPKATELFEQLLKKPNSVIRTNVRAQHQNGSWRILDITGKNLLDNPAVGGIVANFRDITERKQTEDDLKKSEDKFRTIFENANDLIVYVGTDGRVIDANSRIEDLGYTREEVIGREFLQFGIFEPDELQKILTLFRNIKDGKYVDMIEFEVSKKDGTRLFIEVNSKAIERDGQLHSVINIIRDITERKKAEEALRESEDKFRTIFENANDLIVYVDTDGRVIDANSRIEDLGYTREEVIGREFLEFGIFEPEELQKSLALFRDRTKGKYVDITEFEVFKKDGTRLFIEVNSKSIERDGKLHGVINIIRDITERKQAEEALRESEDKFRTIFENANDLIVYVDIDGRVIDINSKIEELGYARDEVIGRKFLEFEIFEPEELQKSLALFKDRVEGKYGGMTEFGIFKKDGTKLFVEVNSRSIVKDDNVHSVINIIRDITERKEAEEALKKAYDDVENQVKKRTAELAESNKQLQKEISDRKKAEEELILSEERFRVLIENSSDGIVLVNDEGSIVYSSPSSENIIGYTSQELIGNPMTSYIHPDDLRSLDNVFGNAVINPGSNVTLEVRYKHKDGSWRWIEGVGNNRLDDPRINGIVTNYRDITDRKQAEQETKRLNIELMDANAALEEEITERKLVEEALRSSEEKFRTIFEDASDEIIYLDEFGTILDVNNRIEDVWGFKRDEVIGKNLGEFNFVLPESFQNISEQLMEMFNSEKPIVSEIKARRKDGSILLTEASGRVIRLGDGRKAVLVIVRDITERRQAEEAIRESEEKYREVVERSNDGIVVIQDGVARFANERMGNIIGYDIQEGLNRPFSDFIDPDELPNVANYYEKRMSGDAVPSIYETILQHKNGNKIFVEFSGGLVMYEGNPAVLGFVRDITNRKKAEEALRDSDERYRDLFETAPASITVLDTSGVIVDCNETTSRLIGYPRETIIGQSFEKLLTIDPGDLPKLAEVYEKMVKGTDVGPLELEIIRSDGERRWIRTVNSLLTSRTEVMGFQIFAMDITERKQDEDRLQLYADKLKDANEELSHYAYVASHDIGAPLRVIRLNTHLLRKELKNISFHDSKDHLNKIDNSVAESLQLAQNLLDLSRIGEQDLEIVRINVGSLVKKLIDSTELSTDIDIVIADKWPTINSNSILLTQIFRNLIDNAIKFNNKSTKHVELQWELKEKDVYQFSVKDNGIGIATRYHGDIFKVFKQLHLKEEYKGAGIGLAIVKKAANTLGGSIQLESKPGKGSTFHVSIPKDIGKIIN